MSKTAAEEQLVFAATEEIALLMDKASMTRTELACRLGCSKGHVTQLLSGERNMTLRTLADLAYALDATFTLEAGNDSGIDRLVVPVAADTEPEETDAD